MASVSDGASPAPQKRLTILDLPHETQKHVVSHVRPQHASGLPGSDGRAG